MNSFLALNGKRLLQPVGESLIDFDLPIKEENNVRMNLCDIFAEMDDVINSLDMIFAS